MEKHQVHGTVSYVPKYLDYEDTLSLKVHHINHTNLTLDLEVFKGSRTIYRGNVSKAQYREWERKCYTSQQLH